MNTKGQHFSKLGCSAHVNELLNWIRRETVLRVMRHPEFLLALASWGQATTFTATDG